jgi:hypothetical protein
MANVSREEPVVTMTRDLPAPALRAFGARCSCGCGRRLRHGDRRADRRARTARKLVAEMEALSFGTDDDEYRRAFLFEGVSCATSTPASSAAS